MRELTIEMIVPHRPVNEVYEILCDFERYPHHTPEVRSVTRDSSNGEKFSTWETNFRGGILRWRERDTFDPNTGTIGFEQIEGDIESFSGWWRINSQNGGSSVYFVAQFDMGIPSLAEIIDPIAEQALRDNIVAIVRGLFGPDVVVVQAAG